jgi:hypothetical protein
MPSLGCYLPGLTVVPCALSFGNSWFPVILGTRVRNSSVEIAMLVSITGKFTLIPTRLAKKVSNAKIHTKKYTQDLQKFYLRTV